MNDELFSDYSRGRQEILMCLAAHSQYFSPVAIFARNYGHFVPKTSHFVPRNSHFVPQYIHEVILFSFSSGLRTKVFDLCFMYAILNFCGTQSLTRSASYDRITVGHCFYLFGGS